MCMHQHLSAALSEPLAGTAGSADYQRGLMFGSLVGLLFAGMVFSLLHSFL